MVASAIASGTLAVLVLIVAPRHSDPVLQRALVVLGQHVNDIHLVSTLEIREMYARTPGAGVPPLGLNAFRLPGDPNIYVNRDSITYQAASKKRSGFEVVRLAGTLLHEQIHDTDGEAAACRLQSDFVRSRLDSVPRNERERIERYWRLLEARAILLSRAERRLRR